MVGKPVGVRVPPLAPWQYSKGIWLPAEVPFSIKTAQVADLWHSEGATSIIVAGNELVRYIRISIRGREKVTEVLIDNDG